MVGLNVDLTARRPDARPPRPLLRRVAALPDDIGVRHVRLRSTVVAPAVNDLKDSVPA